MKPYQERVVQEKAELDDRGVRLAEFVVGPVFETLPAAEQDLLTMQLCAMKTYSELLGLRIVGFHFDGEQV